jgi:glycine hydroxymethyltransferase
MIFAKKVHEDAINSAVFPALQGGPHNHQIAALAVALKEASDESFVSYIKQVKLNAQALAASMMSLGYNIVTGGTDNHIVLWDAKSTGISGSKLEKILERCSISANKNTVLGDKSAISPGGIRLGTPAVTTRGMKESDMEVIAKFLDRVALLARKIQSAVPEQSKKLSDFMLEMEKPTHQAEMQRIREEVETFSVSFPFRGIHPDEYSD